MSATDDLLPPGRRPPCTFSSFVPLPFNKAALDAALRWSLRTKDAGAPLVLVGPSGTGKTHLARAALSARCAVYGVGSTMRSPRPTSQTGSRPRSVKSGSGPSWPR